MATDSKPDFKRRFKVATWWFNGIMVGLMVLIFVTAYAAHADCDGVECDALLGPVVLVSVLFMIWVVGNLVALVIQKFLTRGPVQLLKGH